MGVLKKYRRALVLCTCAAALVACQEDQNRPPTTAETHMADLVWLDMEPMATFIDRFPADVFFKAEGRDGEERTFRASFPDGSSILVLARPCAGVLTGLCVWAAEDQ